MNNTMNKTLTLYLLRHGITESGECFLGKTDARLTDKGFHQMYAALHHANQEYQQIYSSPLQRCSSFAKAYYPNNVINVDECIAEYDFGDWDGCKAANIYEQSPEQLAKFWEDPMANPPPNAEKLAAFMQRVNSFIERLQSKDEAKVLLITHGGVIRALMALCQKRPFQSMLSQPVKHGDLIRLDWTF